MNAGLATGERLAQAWLYNAHVKIWCELGDFSREGRIY
jgi:hypothetical protein